MRNWIVVVGVVGLLAACGRTAPMATQPTATVLSPAIATASVMLTAAAGSDMPRVEPATTAQEGMSVAQVATPEAVSSGDAQQSVPALNPGAAAAAVALPASIGAAEQVVREYFAAFGARRAADAWRLLAPDMRAGMTLEMLESTTLAVQSLNLMRIDSVRTAEARVIYGVTVDAVPVPDLPTRWSSGPNQLYVVVINTPEGWRIAAITGEPPAS